LKQISLKKKKEDRHEEVLIIPQKKHWLRKVQCNDWIKLVLLFKTLSLDKIINKYNVFCFQYLSCFLIWILLPNRNNIRILSSIIQIVKWRKTTLILLLVHLSSTHKKMTITNGIIILKHQCPFEPIKLKRKQIAFWILRGSISFIAYIKDFLKELMEEHFNDNYMEVEGILKLHSKV
jgi:hypothetical protein